METSEVDALVSQLAAGFETLQEEYQKLFGQYQGLERKLANAREQYNELAKLCDSGSVTTPPLSLHSSPGQHHVEAAGSKTVSTILQDSSDPNSRSASQYISFAVEAANTLRKRIELPQATTGVRIWSGPSADRPERTGSMMPSISESPLEQDFTVEGKPSKLGCPFASMAGKKLSSHAASVLNRYNPGGSIPGSPANGEALGSTRSSVSRVNGRESFARRASSEQRQNLADPIKAEICGLDSHTVQQTQIEDHESPLSERAALKSHVAQQQEAGVCPIRFLDQHSPEEVATYFERHKHELPRSHELCVKRYQSNEKQIRELDAKYGNLVSMIQGLGEKHQDYLPKEPEAEEVEEVAEDDAQRDAKVRKWASSVSAQAGQDEGNAEEERTPHFERPLRDVRVGESPSRPWGISVPPKYLEEAAARSEGSSSPVKVKASRLDAAQSVEKKEEAAKCPFDFGKAGAAPSEEEAFQSKETPAPPIFIKSEAKPPNAALNSGDAKAQDEKTSKKMVFTGPVFIGYSAEDAAKILSGLARSS